MKQKIFDRIMLAVFAITGPIGFIGAALDTAAVTTGAAMVALTVALIWAALTPAHRNRQNIDNDLTMIDKRRETLREKRPHGSAGRHEAIQLTM